MLAERYRKFAAMPPVLRRTILFISDAAIGGEAGCWEWSVVL